LHTLKKMGCLKLQTDYYIELNKNSSKKVLTLNKSNNNYRSSYLYGFNGQEKDNEIKGVGNSLDFGARVYDSRLGRWMSLDPMMAKYESISPFVGMGNNPIFFVDIDGRKLILKGNGADIDRVITQMQKSVGDLYTISVNKKGLVSMTLNSNAASQPTLKQQSAIDIYKQISDPEGKTTKVNVVSDDNKVTVGSFKSKSIDIGDMEKFDNIDNTSGSPSVYSASGKLIHELKEQYEKQVNDLGYADAHNSAIIAENIENGSTRSPVNQNGNCTNCSMYASGTSNVTYNEPVKASDLKTVNVQTYTEVTKPGTKSKPAEEKIIDIYQTK
jgi:RHS repeat-associated protein